MSNTAKTSNLSAYLVELSDEQQEVVSGGLLGLLGNDRRDDKKGKGLLDLDLGLDLDLDLDLALGSDKYSRRRYY